MLFEFFTFSVTENRHFGIKKTIRMIVYMHRSIRNIFNGTPPLTYKNNFKVMLIHCSIWVLNNLVHVPCYSMLYPVALGKYVDLVQYLFFCWSSFHLSCVTFPPDADGFHGDPGAGYIPALPDIAAAERPDHYGMAVGTLWCHVYESQVGEKQSDGVVWLLCTKSGSSLKWQSPKKRTHVQRGHLSRGDTCLKRGHHVTMVPLFQGTPCRGTPSRKDTSLESIPLCRGSPLEKVDRLPCNEDTYLREYPVERTPSREGNSLKRTPSRKDTFLEGTPL